MKRIVLSVAATAIAFAVLTMVLPQVRYDGDIVHLVIIAALFGIANGLVKPVVRLLSFPINVMTVGLFGIVVNVALFMGVAWVSESFIRFEFTIAGWPRTGLTLEVIGTALVASIALGVLTTIVGLVVRD